MARAHHVIANQEGGWDVKAEGEFEAIRHFANKERAVEFARKLSGIEHAELVVHDREGGIERKDCSI